MATATSLTAIWARQLRWHQWVKNLLVFVPAVTSFQFTQPALLEKLVLAFVAFCLVASAIYILNDLFDVASDRNHPVKKTRPIAAGIIKPSLARLVSLVFLLVGMAIGIASGLQFAIALSIYVVLTFVYSLWLKRLAIVDAIVLAALYTIRVIAGGLATNITVSFWLLAFSVFFFLSLAWLKRYAELEAALSHHVEVAPGRGYRVTDLPMVQIFGSASAFLAVLIFALYLDSESIRQTYAVPEIAWLAIPLLMYLISRMWLKAHRGEMNEDPILFVLKDAASLVAIFLMALALVEAHLGFWL